MKTRKLSAVATLSAVLLAPAVSMADSPWVPANNNQGYRYQPDHGSTSTGAGGRSAAGVSTPDAASTASATTGKTREQVRNEYLNMSAAERQRLQEMFRGP
ncbi:MULTISPECIES: hypothetical protein [Azohydromonas]|jgi:hypothetical protein|uniref:DUF4148 domain-containing protein n=1 Tax=Azohydromonas lata TaxID=45677 RepID=A0ABU5I9B7_9BURK|nr:MULTISPECIES: hypothetical protein [Azohydromonas]MDZ5455698.1 hypothetical protein [Azohydromonas lata]